VCKLGRQRNLAGPLEAISAYTMKHPPKQFTDDKAREMLEAFIANESTPASYEPASKDAPESIPAE
jgi:hypothetical protein